MSGVTSSGTITEGSLTWIINNRNMLRQCVRLGTEGYPQVISFLDNSEDDLKELLKLIKENGNQEEIEILVKKIRENAQKSFDTAEKLRELADEYDRSEKWDLLWYKNSVGDTDKITKIINEGLR
ncbi:hypothetical protein F8154_13280 [Alkaliphilus pronyensis]|uniref:Uncharacterized protein n=1 Tax=Alkaliphilus pronyensis TaxID=1482732 RepID=A0A6I0F6F1_9FIRM|nr:hypothetical protein [Alkaliphilus pronyensis]KAB3531043.1 hypothetical protein F8154_13280 [Alkaliphilus pronyensis]